MYFQIKKERKYSVVFIHLFPAFSKKKRYLTNPYSMFAFMMKHEIQTTEPYSVHKLSIIAGIFNLWLVKLIAWIHTIALGKRQQFAPRRYGIFSQYYYLVCPIAYILCVSDLQFRTPIFFLETFHGKFIYFQSLW